MTGCTFSQDRRSGSFLVVGYCQWCICTVTVPAPKDKGVVVAVHVGWHKCRTTDNISMILRKAHPVLLNSKCTQACDRHTPVPTTMRNLQAMLRPSRKGDTSGGPHLRTSIEVLPVITQLVGISSGIYRCLPHVPTQSDPSDTFTEYKGNVRLDKALAAKQCRHSLEGSNEGIARAMQNGGSISNATDTLLRTATAPSRYWRRTY
jgi:hypothetical protein